MHIVVAEDPARLAAHRIADRLRDAVRRRGVASVALSGGSTAPPMIDSLVGDDVPWEAVTIWQVDERVAPDGHRARNANQLAPFAALPCVVRPMPVTSSDLRSAARRYGNAVPERLDVVHLGLGDDGHTASWPPGRPDIARSGRPVEIVEAFNGWPRMTLTGRVVNNARWRVVLTTGAAKRQMVERWLLRDTELPVAAVSRRATQVFVDHDAAPVAGLDDSH